jgi:hypoxanthine phosphoribosyltransferase
MLRGADSARDAEFVRELADRLSLPVVVGAINVADAARQSGRGVEETGRELRYGFLLETALEHGCNRIAVGHTMTDQVETFVMRLARGAGLRGLAAMRPVTRAHAFESDAFATDRLPLLIRPLLCLLREEVEQYCLDRGLEFRVDPTNLGRDYTRNKVRLDLLPALKVINAQALEHIARTAEVIADDQDALDEQASLLLDAARVRPPATGWRSRGGSAYSVPALLGQPLAMRRRMVMEALRREGVPVNSSYVQAVEELLGRPKSGKRASLAGGVEAWREFDTLTLASAPGEATPGQSVLTEQEPLDWGGFRLSLVLQPDGPGLGEALAEARREERLQGRDWMMAVLDGKVLPERLVVSARRSGERAEVMGQQRTKMLKKLMIDHRIPASRRASWPIVRTPDGLYIWAPGLPPAKRFAARDDSRGLAILRASAHSTSPARSDMGNNIRVVHDKEEINNRIQALAEQIRATSPAGELTVVGILDDAFVFLADLIRALDMGVSCCFMQVTSHRHGGQTELRFTSEFDPRGRDILLVAGVAATGVTLDYISRQLSECGVKSLRTCVLVDKPQDRRVDLKPDFAAFQTDEFLFGYGLGIQNQFRHLPYLGAVQGTQ